MTVTINQFPQNVINHIALYLNPNDIFYFGLSSKLQYKKAMNQELWKRYNMTLIWEHTKKKSSCRIHSKTLQDFGDIFRLYHIFTSATGLELPSDLTNKFEKEPKDWKNYYVIKSASINEADHEVLLLQGNKEYQDAQKYLKTFKDDMNYSILIQVASKMLWILGKHCVLHNYPLSTN
jgi:hypothetical protein